MGSQTTSHSQKAPTSIVFMPTVFNEAMHLLRDAQEYFTLFGDDDQNRIDTNLRTLYSCEMSRITLRLSAIMTWIMAQRAIIAGKIPSEQAAHYTLEFQDICRVDNTMLHGVLPSYVCHLLDSSLELYERVCRLDVQAQKLH